MNNWGADDLTKFLEVVHLNQKANPDNLSEPYSTKPDPSASIWRLWIVEKG